MRFHVLILELKLLPYIVKVEYMKWEAVRHVTMWRLERAHIVTTWESDEILIESFLAAENDLKLLHSQWRITRCLTSSYYDFLEQKNIYFQFQLTALENEKRSNSTPEHDVNCCCVCNFSAALTQSPKLHNTNSGTILQISIFCL